MFWTSKVGWAFSRPDSLLSLALLASLAAFLLRRPRWGQGLLSATAAAVLAVTLLPIGEWLAYPLERQYRANPQIAQIDGIVVLGGSIDPLRSSAYDQVIVNESAERLLAFVALARRFPEARLVFSGGSGSLRWQEWKEADIAARALSELGLDPKRVLFERTSRNTWENAVRSKGLATPAEGEIWVLITSATHMPRSVRAFCKTGWRVTPYPVDFRAVPGRLMRMEWDFAGHLSVLVSSAKEWMGLLMYRLTGRACSSTEPGLGTGDSS